MGQYLQGGNLGCFMHFLSKSRASFDATEELEGARKYPRSRCFLVQLNPYLVNGVVSTMTILHIIPFSSPLYMQFGERVKPFVNRNQSNLCFMRPRVGPLRPDQTLNNIVTRSLWNATPKPEELQQYINGLISAWKNFECVEQ